MKRLAVFGITAVASGFGLSTQMPALTAAQQIVICGSLGLAFVALAMIAADHLITKGSDQ